MALYTQGDIINEFLVRMNQSTTVGFYTDAILTRWASNAHQWAAGRYKWPMTEGRYSTTFASLGTNEDGYTTLQYPEGFRQDSIRVLTVDGKRFDKKIFAKFQGFLQDNPASTDKIYTDFMRTVLINPNASDLSGTVVAFGQFNVAPLASDANIQDPSALTIFSGVEEDGNEAIVEKMMSYAYQREKSPTTLVRGKMVSASSVHEANAANLLADVWKRIEGEQSGYQTTKDDSMFERFDVLNGGLRTEIYKRDQFTG